MSDIVKYKPEGCWEIPGGRLDPGETPIQAAMREWQEETGMSLPDGDITGHWVTEDGKYEGYVLTINSEDNLDLTKRNEVKNPDDVGFEALAWWDPKQLEDNPSIREEIVESLDRILPLLGKGGGGGRQDVYHKRSSLEDIQPC